jgi:CHAD domain
MTKRKATDIIRYCFKRLYKHGTRMKKGYGEDAIHDFRVDYKKLRAFLRMLMVKMTEPPDLNVPHSLKKMYATAGEVRDRQLCIKRIKADRQAGDAVPGKMHELKRDIMQLSAKEDFLSKKEFDGIEANIIRNLPVVVPIGLITDFVGEKIVSMNGIMEKNKYGDKDLHEIRKGFKDIIYVTTIAKDFKEYGPVPSWAKETLKKADEMAHQLGSFNDAGIALTFLLPRDIRKAGAEEESQLWGIRRRWLAEKRKLKNEILPQLRSMKLAPSPGRAGS